MDNRHDDDEDDTEDVVQVMTELAAGERGTPEAQQFARICFAQIDLRRELETALREVDVPKVERLCEALVQNIRDKAEVMIEMGFEVGPTDNRRPSNTTH